MVRYSVQHRGTSILGCLLLLALVLGGGMWGYHRFFYYAPLVKAGSNHQLFSERENRSAYLEYVGRVRTRHGPSVVAMLNHNQQILRQFRSKGYSKGTEAFERDSAEFIRLLRDSVIEFDSQAVPQVLEPAHRQLSRAHGLCYETVVLLREAQAAEGAEREQLLKAAREKARQANYSGNQGLRDFHRLRQQS